MGILQQAESFISEVNGLNSVEVYMATYGHQNLKDVIFHLKSSPSSGDIATVKINASDISDNSNIDFKFPRIPDSRGKQYYFIIEAPGADPNDSITAWYSDSDTYASGTAYYNQKPQNGDLAFKTHYKPAISDLLSFIGNRYPIIRP